MRNEIVPDDRLEMPLGKKKKEKKKESRLEYPHRILGQEIQEKYSYILLWEHCTLPIHIFRVGQKWRKIELEGRKQRRNTARLHVLASSWMKTSPNESSGAVRLLRIRGREGEGGKSIISRDAGPSPH